MNPDATSSVSWSCFVIDELVIVPLTVRLLGTITLAPDVTYKPRL